MKQWIEVFKNNNIAGKHLLELTNEELISDLHIHSLGHRKDVLSEIGKKKKKGMNEIIVCFVFVGKSEITK